MSKLDELFPPLCKVPAGHDHLGLAAAVRVVAKQSFLRLETQHVKDMTGHILADAAVGAAHPFVPAGARRELQHIAVSLI